MKKMHNESEKKISLLMFGGEEVSKDHPWIESVLSVNSIDNKDLQICCNQIMKRFLNETVDRKEIETMGRKYGETTFKKLASGVTICYSLSGRYVLTPEELEKDLKAVGIKPEKTNIIKTSWEKHRETVLEILRSKKQLPSLVNFRWSIDRRLASDAIYEVLKNYIILEFEIKKGEVVEKLYMELIPEEFSSFLEDMKEIDKLLRKKELWGF